MAQSNAGLYVGGAAALLAAGSIIYTVSEVTPMKEDIDQNKLDIVKLARALRDVELQIKNLQKTCSKLESARDKIDKIKYIVDNNYEAITELESLKDTVNSVISTMNDNNMKVESRSKTKTRKHRRKKDSKKKKVLEDESDEEPDMSQILSLVSQKSK